MSNFKAALLCRIVAPTFSDPGATWKGAHSAVCSEPEASRLPRKSQVTVQKWRPAQCYAAGATAGGPPSQPIAVSTTPAKNRRHADQGNLLKPANCRLVFFCIGSRSSRIGRFFCPQGVGSMTQAIGFCIQHQTTDNQCLSVVASFWCVKSMLKRARNNINNTWTELVHGTVWAHERAAEGRLQGGLG